MLMNLLQKARTFYNLLIYITGFLLHQDFLFPRFCHFLIVKVLLLLLWWHIRIKYILLINYNNASVLNNLIKLKGNLSFIYIGICVMLMGIVFIND